MDVKVKEYIEKQSPSQRAIIEEVRKIFAEVLGDCDEKYAWGVIALGDSKFYIATMKERVHVGFSIVGLSSEEVKLFDGSGKTMRHIKIPDLKSVDKAKLKKLIELVNKKAKCVEC